MVYLRWNLWWGHDASGRFPDRRGAFPDQPGKTPGGILMKARHTIRGKHPALDRPAREPADLVSTRHLTQMISRNTRAARPVPEPPGCHNNLSGATPTGATAKPAAIQIGGSARGYHEIKTSLAT
jgi:hypothetical protein